MKKWISDCGRATLFCADCRDVYDQIDPVPVCLTDPPYGLSMTGWDHQVPGQEFWDGLPILPGGHLVAFGGTRTFHRLVCAIEDSGYEVRDVLMFMYGSGFPKSLDVGKKTNKQWDGYKTCLKPAYEPILWAMRPVDGNYAANALRHGVAGINIDACRIGVNGGTKRSHQADYPKTNDGKEDRTRFGRTGHAVIDIGSGRYPSNIIIDDAVGKMIDEQSGITKSNMRPVKGEDGAGYGHNGDKYQGKNHISYGFLNDTLRGHNDSGGASRFFYTAKASASERFYGCKENDHISVKPIALLSYLIKLFSPPENRIILDPFCGSGSTGIACINHEIKFIGVEKDEHFFEVAKARILRALSDNIDFGGIE